MEVAGFPKPDESKFVFKCLLQSQNGKGIWRQIAEANYVLEREILFSDLGKSSDSPSRRPVAGGKY